MMCYRRILTMLIPLIMCPIVSFADYQAIVNIGALNIRGERDSSSAVLGEVSANTRLDVSREGDKWLKTKIKNKEGYLFQDYVDLYEVTSFGKATFKQNFSMKDSSVNFYKGEVVPVYDYFNDYYLVKKNFRYFYIHNSVVNIDKVSNITRPVVVKHGLSTKLKSVRIEKEEIVKTKQKNQELVSILDDNDEELLTIKSDSTLDADSNFNSKQSSKVLYNTKMVPDMDLFDGYELDIESVEQGSKLKGKNSNKKEEIVTKNSIDSSKAEYFEFISNNNLDKYVKQSKILSYAVEELGKPYVYGANGPSTFDCSGFTSHVFKKSGISIPRTSYLQSEKGDSVDRSNLKAGDLVFFDTRSLSKITVEIVENSERDSNIEDSSKTSVVYDTGNENSNNENKKRLVIKPSKVTHVGIYIGEGKFIHASSGQKKVVINELDSKYYSERYYGAKRYR